MITVGHQFDVPVPPQAVFALISDFGRRPQWLDLVSAEQTSDGPVGPGTTFREVNRILGRDKEVRFEVLELVPSQRLVYQSEPTGGFAARVEWDLAAGETGTEIGLQVHLRLTGLWRLLRLFGSRPLKSQVERDMASLEQLLVTGSGQPQSS